MPALLTENGFIDNIEDAAKLKDPNFIEKIAKGHAQGIVKIANLKPITPNLKPITPKDSAG